MYKTKETAIKHLEKGEKFEHKNFNHVRDNEEVALAAIKKNFKAIKAVSDRLRTSLEFNRKAFEIQPDVYLYQRYNEHLMQDREIQKHAAKSDYLHISIVHATKNDKVIEIDKELALIAAKANGHLFNSFKTDKEVVLEAVKKDGNNLEFASAELRADKEVVREAVQNAPEVIKHADKSIQNLCHNKDAFLTLNSLINMERMQQQLKPKALSQTRSLKI